MKPLTKRTRSNLFPFFTVLKIITRDVISVLVKEKRDGTERTIAQGRQTDGRL